ncbi:Uncharacterized protein APZ42_007890, partial [Daphnia magna]
SFFHRSGNLDFNRFVVSRLSTHGLATFVDVCSFFIFIMSATVCCLFFWWQTKTNFNKHEQTKESFTAEPRFKLPPKYPSSAVRILSHSFYQQLIKYCHKKIAE